eukprot:1350118-Pleurochrysis_carterae.AAC.1
MRGRGDNKGKEGGSRAEEWYENDGDQSMRAYRSQRSRARENGTHTHACARALAQKKKKRRNEAGISKQGAARKTGIDDSERE